MVGFKTASALLALFASAAVAVPTLKVEGADFVDSASNARFQIIGMAYQPGGASGFKPDSGVDPLSDKKICQRDAAIMQKLGINTIRVYNLDPLISHDECASIFNAAGIYLLIDVNSPLPNESINNFEPWTSYNDDYLKRVFQVVEAFKGYPNLLGFFSGNEVINDEKTAGVVPQYIRAVTRDIKQYVKNHADREIPVGYSAADVRDVLVDTFNYLSCAENGNQDDTSYIDFFGINSYSWCGQSNLKDSTYAELIEDFSKTTVPVFFSEYGCNEVLPRGFSEVQAIYGAEMRNVMSGGVVYEWTQEDNNYGFVKVNDNNTVSLLKDFDTIQQQYNKLDTKAITSMNSTATSLKAPACKTSLVSSKLFNSNFTLPVTPKTSQGYIKNGVTGAKGGKTSKVTDTAVGLTVYGSDGKEITNLKLNILNDNQSNLPSGTTTSGGTGTSSGGSSSSSSGAATVMEANCLGMLAVGAAALWAL